MRTTWILVLLAFIVTACSSYSSYEQTDKISSGTEPKDNVETLVEGCSVSEGFRCENFDIIRVYEKYTGNVNERHIRTSITVSNHLGKTAILEGTEGCAFSEERIENGKTASITCKGLDDTALGEKTRQKITVNYREEEDPSFKTLEAAVVTIVEQNKYAPGKCSLSGPFSCEQFALRRIEPDQVEFEITLRSMQESELTSNTPDCLVTPNLIAKDETAKITCVHQSSAEEEALIARDISLTYQSPGEEAKTIQVYVVGRAYS
jgi:hypothetical protein